MLIKKYLKQINNTDSSKIKTVTGTDNYHFIKDEVEIYKKRLVEPEYPDLPKKGTPFAEMNWAGIQAIAKANKADEYGLKIGDTKNSINKDGSETPFSIIEIGDGYIEFINNSYDGIIEHDNALETKYALNSRTEIFAYDDTSFYAEPQVDYNDKTESKMTYVDSNARRVINNWYENVLEEDLKNRILDTERVYNSSVMTYFPGTEEYIYTWSAQSFEEPVIDKIYPLLTSEISKINALPNNAINGSFLGSVGFSIKSRRGSSSTTGYWTLGLVQIFKNRSTENKNGQAGKYNPAFRIG